MLGLTLTLTSAAFKPEGCLQDKSHMVLLEERVKTIFLTLLILNTNFILIDLILKVFFPPTQNIIW